MEDLRIRGNAVFPTDLQSALALYQEAITLYEKSYGMEGKAPTSAVEEYTRCTGNALTCLFKLEQFSECATLAIKALRVNPLMSKAYAFIGRCMLVDNSSALCKHRREMGPLQYLCRAVYLQPSMAASVVHLISESIDRLLEETYAAQGGGTNSNGNIGAISSNARESGVNTNENGEVDSNCNNNHEGRAKGAADPACGSADDDGPSIEVREGSTGKCVVAATRLPAHIGVSSILHPFSACSYGDMVGDGVCVNCGAYRSSLLPKNAPDEHDVGRISCGGCGLALYCSLSCANQYQSQHTQYECHLFKRLKEMRCALEASAEQNEVEGSQCEAPSNLIIDFFTMASHCITTLAGIKSRRPGYRVVLNELQGHAAEVSQNLSHMVRMVGELLRDEELPLEVARLIGIIRCNTIEVNNELSLGVGQALHATTITSYFNHSCSPNCAIQGEFIVTTRVIAAGEELTISYMPQLYWPVALRREELANTYYFHCSCERCRDNENDPFEAALVAVLRSGCEETGGGGGAQDGNNAKAARVCGLENHLEAQRKHITDVQTLCNRIRSMDPSDITTTDRNELQRLLQKCCEELYPFHYLCHELRNALSFTYAALGDTKDCLKSCLDELLLWECIVPGAHPVKRLKLLNSMQCCEDLRGKGDELGNNNIGSMALIPLLEKLSRLYCC